MAMNNNVGALFDLDGVIVDTEGIYTDFWHEIGTAIYPVRIDDFAHIIKGNTLAKILDTYFPDKVVQDDIVARLAAHEAGMEYRLFDGVRDFLEGLRRAGIPAAIVTSSGDKKMSHLFRCIPDLRSYFDVVITDKDVTRSKPDPEGYLIAAKAIGRDIKDCYVFEDSFSGIAAGMASGAITIGVATTNSSFSLKGKAHAVIGSFDGFMVEGMLAVLRK